MIISDVPPSHTPRGNALAVGRAGGREDECQEGGQGRVVIIHLTSKDNVYEDIQMTPFEVEEKEIAVAAVSDHRAHTERESGRTEDGQKVRWARVNGLS